MRPVFAMPPSSCAQYRSRSEGGRSIRSHTSQPMWFSGTLLNFATVLAGGVLGTFLGDRMPPRLRENVMAGVGLFTLVMGVRFAIDTASLLYLLGAILIGGGLGSLAGIERRLNDLRAALQRPVAAPHGPSPVAEGFVPARSRFSRRPPPFPRRVPHRP